MSDETVPVGRPVVRDAGRFARFHPESRAVIPPDARGEIDWKPTRVLIAERQAALLGVFRTSEAAGNKP